MTPGMKSSEFYLTLLSYLVGAGLLVASAFTGKGAAVVLQVLGVAKMLLGQLGYTVGRSMVKAAEAKPKGGIEVFSGDASA